MARSFSGVNQSLDSADGTTQITATPLTMACWFNTSVASTLQALMHIGLATGGGTASYFGLEVNNSDQVIASARAGSTTNSAVTSTTYSTNTWSHACGVFASATDRRAFLNGGGKGTNATSRTPTSLSRYIIGLRNDNGGDLTGLIAEACIWSAALDDSEVAALAAGYRPDLIRPGSVVEYWSIFGRTSPEINLYSATALTVNGATLADHPRIYYPRKRLIVPKATVTANKLPPLLTNAQTFFAPKIARAVAPALLTNTQSFPAAHVTGLVRPALLTNAQTFYSPTLKLTVKPAALTNTQSFPAATISVASASKQPPLLTNTQTVYGPTIRVTLKPSALVNAQTFQAPRIASALKPVLLTNAQVFFGPRLRLTIKPSALSNGQTFGAPTILLAGAVVPPLYVNAQVFYGPTIVTASHGVGKRRRLKRINRLNPNYVEPETQSEPESSRAAEPEEASAGHADAPSSVPFAEGLVAPPAPVAKVSRSTQRRHAKRAYAETAEHARLLAEADALLAQGMADLEAGRLAEAERLEAEFHAMRRKREAEERFLILAAMELLF